MKASSISFQAAVLLVIMGMGWGIIMAISEDHTTMPAHAHLNLLGWVSLFLFGIFYHLHPAIDLSRSAMVQVCVWIISTIGLTLGVAMIHRGNHLGDPIAAVASVLALLDMILFSWLVYRRDVNTLDARDPFAVPAE